MKHTSRKSGIRGAYATTPPILFPTVTKTATGPHVAHVAQASSTVTSDQAGPAKLAPLPEHTLPTSGGRSIRPVRISCVEPSCPVTFTRRLSMRRHAIQFHKLKGVGVPATEAEYEAAVLDAAERSSWARAGAISYDWRRVRFRRPVKTEIERFPEERRSGEQPALVDPPDHRDVLSRSASPADVHPAFGCEDIRDPITGEEWITEQRPEICAPVDYLHQLLRDKPTLPVQGIVDSAIRQHGWTGGMALHARFTVDYLEAGRQQILSDIRALVPETLDEHSSLPFAVRVHQYLVQFPPRPK